MPPPTTDHQTALAAGHGAALTPAAVSSGLAVTVQALRPALAQPGPGVQVRQHPALKYGLPDAPHLRAFEGFVSSFDPATRNPRYVVERITAASSSGEGDRSGAHLLDFGNNMDHSQRWWRELLEFLLHPLGCPVAGRLLQGSSPWHAEVACCCCAVSHAELGEPRCCREAASCCRANVAFREDEGIQLRFRNHLSDFRQSGCAAVL